MQNRKLIVLMVLVVFLLTGCKTEAEKTNTTISTTESNSQFKKVTIDGYEFNYQDIGEGEPIVLVHGTIGDYRSWNAQMKPFSENHRVISLSRRYAYPNNQTMQDSTGHFIESNARDLIQFLEKLKLGKVHLVGHSYGAFTSLEVTLQRPDLIKSLTLGEPPIHSIIKDKPGVNEMRDKFFQKFFVPAAEAFQNNENEKAISLFVGGVMSDSLYYGKASTEIREKWLENPTELKAIVSGPNPFPDVECENLKKIKMPVLLIKGDKSPTDLRLIIDELHKCIDGSNLMELSDSSHGLQLENPEDFNSMVLRFIGEN